MTMKKSVIVWVVLLFLLGAAAAVFFFCRDTDEKRVRQTLKELCSFGSKSSGENPALGALKANRADKVFAPKCRFNFGILLWDGECTPTEIGAKVLRIQALFQWIRLDFSDLQSVVENDQAQVSFTGQFTGVSKQGGSKVDEIRDIEAVLVKQKNGEWKITSMNIRKVLEK